MTTFFVVALGFKVSVRALTSKLVNISCNEDSTVLSVKEGVFDLEGIPMSQQRLTLGGRVLSDSDKVSSFPGISDGCTTFECSLFIRGGMLHPPTPGPAPMVTFQCKNSADNVLNTIETNEKCLKNYMLLMALLSSMYGYINIHELQLQYDGADGDSMINSNDTLKTACNFFTRSRKTITFRLTVTGQLNDIVVVLVSVVNMIFDLSLALLIFRRPQ